MNWRFSHRYAAGTAQLNHLLPCPHLQAVHLLQQLTQHALANPYASIAAAVTHRGQPVDLIKKYNCWAGAARPAQTRHRASTVTKEQERWSHPNGSSSCHAHLSPAQCTCTVPSLGEQSRECLLTLAHVFAEQLGALD